MPLTPAQKHHLIEHGYAVLPNAVPRPMVEAALQAINHNVGQGMDKADMTRLRAQSYCPELQHDPVIVGLLTQTPAWEQAESAVGAGKLQQPWGAQIALRFPGPAAASAGGDPRPPSPHIDGMYTPDNGVKPGVIDAFTMLAAVFLSDVPGPWRGNFTVWPGSHRAHADYLRAHGPESLLEGMPKVDRGEPLQITAAAGDVVLTHYLLAHSAAANTSPNIRYACFFRLQHVEHLAHRRESMMDPWLEWEGLRDELAGARR